MKKWMFISLLSVCVISLGLFPDVYAGSKGKGAAKGKKIRVERTSNSRSPSVVRPIRNQMDRINRTNRETGSPTFIRGVPGYDYDFVRKNLNGPYPEGIYSGTSSSKSVARTVDRETVGNAYVKIPNRMRWSDRGREKGLQTRTPGASQTREKTIEAAIDAAIQSQIDGR